MTCPKCQNSNVTMSNTQTTGKIRTKNNGCLWQIGRWILIICTCGLWLLVGKRKEKSNIEYKNQTEAICQSCGHRWTV